MSTKSGFFTLNRLLGKKNRESKLTKSTSNLSTSITTLQNIDESSQKNRITPLPTATSNAPFEQTFRITVLLPKGQMYVARLGARVKLEKLLDLVCENKQLEKDKYEFRHSVDSSQVFSCESTIGAVGLTEIRLCDKSEPHDNFNSEEIMKLQRTVGVRDSLSSSEFSSRYSKNTQKTASPYSSSNSLNSMDSTGMNTSYRGPISMPSKQSTPKANKPPIAPARKKRTAPPPPVYCTIPEREPFTPNIDLRSSIKGNEPIPRKEFYVSSPNLSQTAEFSVLHSTDIHTSNTSIDCNGNNKISEDNNNDSKNSKTSLEHTYEDTTYMNGFAKMNSRPASLYITNQTDLSLNSLPPENKINNKYSFNSYQNISTVGQSQKMPEPSPRKKIVNAKKKVAPAPPPRVVAPSPVVPVAQPRSCTQINISTTITEQSENKLEEKLEPKVEEPEYAEVIKRSSRDILNNKQQNNIGPENNEDNNESYKEQEITKNHSNLNISKVMLNRSPTPEQHPDLDSLTMSTNYSDHQLESFETDSKHADSGIGEPVPSPPPDSLPSENHSPTECKSPFESSSEDEEQIKVYNLKLGKTIVKSLADHKTFEDLTVISNGDNTTISDDQQTNCDTSSIRSETTTWNFTIPAPPNFADNEKMTSEIQTDETVIPSPPDAPITPILKERPKMNFESLIIDPMLETISFKESEKNTQTKSQSKIPNQISNNTIPNLQDLNVNDVHGKDENNDSIPIQDQMIEKIISKVASDGIEGKSLILENKQITESSTDDIRIENDPISKAVAKFTEIEAEMSAEKSTPIPVSRKLTSSLQNNKKTEEINKTVSKSNMDSSADSFVSAKSEVVNELSSFLSEIGKKPIVQNKSAPSEEIESSKPSTLDNFSIQKYSESKSIDETSKLPKSESSEEGEKIYRKRSNASITSISSKLSLQSRQSITRSDSFHSTQQRLIDSNANSPTFSLRSASYLSLQKLESNSNLGTKFTDTNGRKSSSELSIGESPSLQSLIVMKSILNSRKNSDSSEISTNNNQNESTTTKTDNNENVVEKSSTENVPKKTMSQDIAKVESSTSSMKENVSKNESVEKIWRYSGPPSINFSTWSERPKVQVSIKNEGDYIFGNTPQTPPSTPMTPITPVSEPLQKPITSRQSMPPFNKKSPSFAIEPRLPFVRSVEYKKNSSGNSISSSNESSGMKPPTVFPKPMSRNLSTVNQLPKTNKPGINSSWNFRDPVVNGFNSLDRICQTQETPQVNGFNSLDKIGSESSTITYNQKPSFPQVTLRTTVRTVEIPNNDPVTPTSPFAGVTLRRSSSNNKDKPEIDNQTAFSQFTLRKTGLKEKILLSSNQTDTKNTITTTTTKIPSVTNLQEVNTAKISLVSTKSSYSDTSKSLINNTIISLNDDDSASSGDFPTPPSCPPPPPPPPVIRAVVTKQTNNNDLKSPSADTHSELLQAIRNFKAETLKRA